MKPVELKNQFIILRAENLSLSAVSKELDISKATAQKWDRELKEEISILKADNLKALYNTYSMTKEARIKSLGNNLAGIDKALSEVDLKQISPEKLLELKLKYTHALKAEYLPLPDPVEDNTSDVSPAYIMAKYADLLNRIDTGEISQSLADKENSILSNLLRAYEATELQRKIEALETILDSKKV